MEESTRQESINLVPIGRAVNGIKYPGKVEWETITSEVFVAPQLLESLDGTGHQPHFARAAETWYNTHTREEEAVECESETLCPAMFTNW